MDAIEAYLNMLYFEEINNLIEDIQQKHSAQSYMHLVYVLEERRYQMSSMRNARISTAAGMLNPAYEALDNALPVIALCGFKTPAGQVPPPFEP